ncbi:MAG TPA: quinone-dependent dihydroorotate dehydrogenase [Luteibaculaceae bacterium]|nr:quinone-dependent dihydroorotate dehydrogenase [Luteibaculaceae bacterium]
MYNLIRPILFAMSPERAHHFTFAALKAAFAISPIRSLFIRSFAVKDSSLERVVAGIRFPNPVGLAAGFDKDARLFNEFGALGFGFVEIGTLTPLGQPGNPQPRLFRLPIDGAIINRMGFNNEGLAKAILRLKKRNPGFVLGGNIGKNKVTENEDALSDYTQCFEALFPYVDYFVVNVSSPNTPNLRALQDKEPLQKLLSALQSLNLAKASTKPIFLKIAPDLTDEQLDDIVEIVGATGIAGVIATNTTISREGLQTPVAQVSEMGMGGLSGKPLTKRSTEVIRYLHTKSSGSFPIIGVGGIHSAADALEKLQAGASLIQLYTGFIYRGPALIKEINQALLNAQ